jgi:cupin fold WbuC family metalloprotein
MISCRPFNEEVLYATDPIVRLTQGDVAELIKLADRNPRKRIRICAHRDVGDKLHEMLIVHVRDTYVRPHKHPGKSESFHLIKGEVDVVVFDEAGLVTNVIRMGDYASGKTFYYRMTDPCYHTLLIQSDVIVFHETTNGPFQRSETVFAPWAPEEAAEAARRVFMEALAGKVATFTGFGQI